MEVYIIGCGGNSKIVVDILNLCGNTIVGFFDDNHDPTILIHGKYKLIGKITDISYYPNINIINSIGCCKTRNKMYQELKHLDLNWVNCIHPSAYLSPSVNLGIGNIICYGAVINSCSNIGDFNLINTYAIIEHDCIVGNFNHFAPKSTICGSVIVNDINLFGVGSSSIPNIQIGSNNIIGAMAVIIKNISDNNVYVGNPAKKIK